MSQQRFTPEFKDEADRQVTERALHVEHRHTDVVDAALHQQALSSSL